MSTHSIAVLRHSLYLPSERFIPDQAKATGVSPLMVSRDRIVDAVDGLETVSIADLGRPTVLRYTLFRDPSPLIRLLRSADVKVLHAHFGVEGLYARGAAARLGIPLITTLHGFDVSRSTRSLLSARKPAWMYYAAGRSRFLSQAEHLICVSEHVRRRAIAGGARDESIRVITTGVDTAALSPSPVPASGIVVHVARLVEKKGTADLLAAFAVVVKTLPGARLNILGDGPLRGDLTELAVELGISDQVSFLGARGHSDVLAAIAEADVLCQPSITAGSGDQEGLPQVVLEAGALGRPVVSTIHGGIPEGIVHGSTGLLVEERDVAALADSLVSVLRDQNLARSLGSAAVALVRQKFDLGRQSAKVAEMYREVEDAYAV